MAPVVLVTGGSGLVGQGIRWQVRNVVMWCLQARLPFRLCFSAMPFACRAEAPAPAANRCGNKNRVAVLAEGVGEWCYARLT